MPLYTIADAYVLRSRVLEALELAAVSRDPDLRRELLTFVFCGGGFSGIEGAAAIEDLVHEALRYYPSIEPGEPRFILAPHGDRLLEQIDEKLGDYVLKRFERRDVDVRLGVGVTNVTARSATLSTGEVVPTRTVMWAAGIEASPLLRELRPAPGPARRRQGGTRPPGPGSGQCVRARRLRGGPRRDGVLLRADGPERRARGPGRRRGTSSPSWAAGGRAIRSTTEPIGSLASLGHREAVAQIGSVRVSGLPAWLMWRGIYLGKLPRFSRKVQVGLDWIGDLFNPAEIAYLPIEQFTASRSR